MPLIVLPLIVYFIRAFLFESHLVVMTSHRRSITWPFHLCKRFSNSKEQKVKGISTDDYKCIISNTLKQSYACKYQQGRNKVFYKGDYDTKKRIMSKMMEMNNRQLEHIINVIIRLSETESWGTCFTAVNQYGCFELYRVVPCDTLDGVVSVTTV